MKQYYISTNIALSKNPFKNYNNALRRIFFTMLILCYLLPKGVLAQSYCTPIYGNSCSSGDFIDYFSFNTLSKTASGCNGAVNNYYYDSILSTSVEIGATYPINVQSGAAWAQGFGVWIDYNQNGSFDDAGEFVYSSATASTTLFSGTVTIPANALSGTTRLRVRCNYGATVASTESCSNIAYGEAEDYNVIITSSNSIHFTLSTDSTCANIPFIITNTSTDTAAATYYWDFNDGNNQTQTGVGTITHQYAYPSTYTITVSAYDSGGGFIASSSNQIYVQQGTNGMFYMSKDTVCPGEQVSFGLNNNYTFIKWMFSDGTFSTNQYPTHSFSGTGTFWEKMICSTPCGNDTIKRKLVVTNSLLPNAGFSFYPAPSACPNKTISFNPTDYSGTQLWNFGDGVTSTVSSPNHKYTTLGIKTITHSVTNSCGNTSTTTQTISIDTTIFPTNANFGYSPNTPVCPGIQISFNSYNSEGLWSWNFGDGISATGQNPKHTYTSAGSYVVTHTITNECNNSFSKSDTLIISDTIAPDPNFSFYPNPACPNDLISFNPSEYNGKTYLWDFGDGSTSSLKYPSHQYATTGIKTITLTVKNFCNIQRTFTQTVTISGGLPITIYGNMNAYPQVACHNQPISFDAGNWGFPTYIWNFGDGVIDTTANANFTHSYANVGTYTAQVTIANNCGSDTTLQKIISINSSSVFPNYPLNAYPQTACPGENVNVNAPWGYPTYSWNMGDGSPAFSSSNNYITYSYSVSGSHIIAVTVTDYCGNDSIYKDTVTVGNSTYFCSTAACSTSVYAASPSCPNSNVSFNAQSGYAWYKWVFGDGDTLISSSYQVTHPYDTVGTYNYSVTITNFCGKDTTLSSSVVIDNSSQVPSWLNLYAYPDVVCPNQAVTFNADMMGNSNSYASYEWNFGDGYLANGTGNVSHTYTTPGTYNVSVKITNFCGNFSTIYTTISVDTSATFPNWMSMWNNPSPACPGSPVSLETTAGYSSYQWSFGDGTSVTTSTSMVSHVYASTGNYYSSVIVTNSCGNSVTLYKTVNINNTVTINNLDIYLPNNPACPGDVVMLNVNTGGAGGMGGGSNAGITFSWDYGDGSPIDTTIGTGSSHVYASAGIYNVVVTATNTCGNSKTAGKLVTINTNSSPQFSPWTFGVLTENSQSVSAVCPGDIMVFYFEGINSNNVWNFGDGSTGTAIDIFVRSDGVTVTTIKHAYATPGTYNYSLTLTNNCLNNTTLSKSIVVSTGMLISGGFMIQPPSSTLGYTTCGQISFVAFGGNSFTWDFGDGYILTTVSPTMGHSYTNSGNYTVKVTITNGCGNSATYVKTLIVNGMGGTSVGTSSVVPPTCNGGTNGSATATVTGGQAPYTYVWYDNLGQLVSSSVSATNLTPGTYMVSVTDNNGCAGSTAVVITNPAEVAFTVSSTSSSCGGSSGTASVSGISGGTSPYTYLWEDGQTTSTATGLTMGTYSVTVSGANGCSASGYASISESGTTLSVASTTNVTCNGGTNGAVNISVSGGTAPYSYVWSNGALTQNISGVISGNYSVVVTDAGGCHSTINASISGPSAINVNATSAVSPTCGNFNGSAIANVTGGTSPYTYLWPNAANQTTQTATGLPAGTYTVNVTDAVGCTKTGAVSLSNANAPVITSAVSQVSCNGSGNGAVDLTVTGGTGPYLYTWNLPSPQTNNQDVNTLAPGTYFVQILDASSCSSFQIFTITQPSVLATTVTNTSVTCSNTDGTATAAPTGGNTPYTYSWTGGGQTTQTATGLALGGYTVTVTDNKGCTATGNTSIAAITLPTEMCMVSVDPLSTHNIVYWEKPVVTNIDSFKVYREDATNIYSYIGSVAYDSLSEYHDYGVDPNTTTKRYKISTLDNCGQESVKSNYHNTIYIVDNGSGQFTWNPLYTIENSGNPVTNYLLMRDDNSTGAWAQVASTAGTQNTLVDPAYASYSNGNWRVETAWGITCTPTRASINTTRSNIKHTSVVSGINSQQDLDATNIYPNPANENVSIELKESILNANIRIMNSIGQLVYEQTIIATGNSKTIKQINTGNYAKGIYTIVIETNKAKVFKKLVVN